MPIIGSTAAFPLRAVLEFLAASGRTGRLVVQAADHTALFAFRDGRALASGIAPGAATPGVQVATDPAALADTVAELEALGAGQFAFHAGGIGGTATGFELAAVLADLDRRDGVTPIASADRFADGAATVHLAASVTFRHEQIDDADWAVLRAVGDGAEIMTVAARLGTTLPSAANRLARLHERGLVVAPERRARTWAAPMAQAG